MTAEKILDVARSQLGIKENPPNSNKVKFNTAFYEQEVSGSQYPGASQLFYGGKRTASCSKLLSFHTAQKIQGGYLPGDIIFFNFKGKKNTEHVGICESWDGEKITTIDGNTGTGNEANGGAVLRRRRDKSFIVGAYRPVYQEDTMTQAEFDQKMDDYLSHVASQPASAWAQEFLAQAQKEGITDGTRPQSFATREEVATMLLNLRK